MPLDPTLKKVLIIGSGPIQIGQAAEFDYAGTQACLAVREEGIKVVLVNSNPATIQTDRDTADIVYIEPLTLASLSAIIERERPDGLIAGMGGQTALNLAVALTEAGVLAKYGVRLLGTNIAAIQAAEDRHEFAALLERLGQPVLPHAAVTSVAAGEEFAAQIGFPLVIRAAFCLGGTGSGVARDHVELRARVSEGLRLSPVGQVLLEKSVAGWAEIEVEVVRDGAGNAIQICNMENLDPMGIHTGESIVVAPTQTLPNAQVQRLRSAALTIVGALGVEGGCNCQFALNQDSGEVAVIEVNPRLSRSSALASKATGYPIARVAAKIALGYTLAELRNSITAASAALEPALDYVVVKMPRWPFDKFPHLDAHIGVAMKSTGEVMAIGRRFEEAMHKAIRSLDDGAALKMAAQMNAAQLTEEMLYPTHRRLAAIIAALAQGWDGERIHQLTSIHRWFIARLTTVAAELETTSKPEVSYKMVDTCAGEFAATTPYFYSTAGGEDEAPSLSGPKVIILGGGPIRIGQGIEFDYSAVHAARTLRELGVQAIMVNNNPETVSTDYNQSDRLYFEPLAEREVMNIIAHERDGLLGVIAQFGGQTALNLVAPLARQGVNILGTPPAAIAVAEDRRQSGQLAARLGLAMPAWGTVQTLAEAQEVAATLGYPVLLRPSYVLGGRAMRVVHNEAELAAAFAALDSELRRHPVLIDRFLEGAIELDVDAVSDGHDCAAVVMEQVEHAGIHSGDSACVYPPYTLPPPCVAEVERATALLAQELGVIGLMNVQFALHEGILYLLEVNARASRTVPFASKAAGIPLARLGTQVILGAKLRDLDLTTRRDRVAVKLPVFPFRKLPDLVPLLRPEMQSTGETMGLAADFPNAYAKALAGAGFDLSGGASHALVVGTDKLQAAIILEQAGFAVKSELVEVGVAGWDDVALVVYMGDASAAPLDLLREATLRGVPVIGDIRALEAYLCAYLLGHPWLPTAL